jgi:hypothetical protein
MLRFYIDRLFTDTLVNSLRGVKLDFHCNYGHNRMERATKSAIPATV